jgi:hypothetical protein
MMRITDGQCMAWAKKDTGIDPAAAAAPVSQQTGPATGGGERVRGAVSGAVIGGIAGDAGAGVGAAASTMAGGARARNNQAAPNQQAQR